jgi:hypothetical protein
MEKHMSKHTPGPWTLEEPSRHNGYDTWKIAAPTLVEPLGSYSEWSGRQERAANARLIAAAPELLAACQRFLDAHAAPSTANLRGFVESQIRPCRCGPCDLARAAIAKAEGGAA